MALKLDSVVGVPCFRCMCDLRYRSYSCLPEYCSLLDVWLMDNPKIESIDFRLPPRFRASKETIVYALELNSRGFSSRDISRLIGEKLGKRVSHVTVSKWIKANLKNRF